MDDAKQALRREALAALHALPARTRAQEEDVVNAAIQATPEWTAARRVLLFRAKHPEFSVTALGNAAFRDGKTVLLPRVLDAAAGTMTLHAVRGWDDVGPGAFGIQEPLPHCPEAAPDEVDLAIVPGVAFDRQGHRLGQGGGFYDRLLPLVRAPVWAPCFDIQVLDAVPARPHDRAVDRVWSLAMVLAG